MFSSRKKNLQGSHALTSRWCDVLIHHRFPFLVLFHLGLMAAAYSFAYYLRFEGPIPQAYQTVMLRTLPVVLLVQGVLFYYYDLYSGLWRYVSFADVRNIIEATLISLILILNVNLLFTNFLGAIPKSIYVLDFLLLVAFSAGARLAVRSTREMITSWREGSPQPRVIIVGPVIAAEPLLREMLAHFSSFLPVAVIDPESRYQGSRIHNVLICGGLNRLIPMIKRYDVQELIFAWPEAPEHRLNQIIEECRPFGIRFKIIPSIQQVLQGRFRLADVREVELEDLLPRPAVYIDRQPLAAFLAHRMVLVTGAGGSIGSEICRQVAGFQPRGLILLERAENSLYDLNLALKQQFPDLAVQEVVGSVNDGPGLLSLFQAHRPDLVFHAAAYKHVPLMERYPVEAAYNNILGTRNLLQAALATGTERFVLISTDKAVNPTSVMGVSKRIAERYTHSLNGSKGTKFLITRFGNVLGSAGSVVPLFKKQILNGGPVTVTHPEIARFFMTIPEAVQLVLQAAYMGQGGDIFVLNMGRSVKIHELAEKLCLLAGKTPGEEVDIIYTGLRPGEKLFEELFNADEKSQPTEHPLILRALGPEEDASVWEGHLEEIAKLVRNRDAAGLRAKFHQVVPDYQENDISPETAGLPDDLQPGNLG